MNASVKKWVIVVGWGILVIVGVRLADGIFDFRQNQMKTLLLAREQLSRLQGWVQVQEQVRARREEILGPIAKNAGANSTWAVLQGLEQAAKEEGMSVAELRPTWIPAQRHVPAVLRLDEKLEGLLEKVGGLLQRLPKVMPGVEMENLQLMPLGENRVQVLLRIHLSGLES